LLTSQQVFILLKVIMAEKKYMTVYHLFQKIYVLLDDGDRRTLGAVGLTPTQYNLLQRLGTEVEAGATITELAQVLLCTRGNITRLVRRLEKNGLVQVGGDSDDQRLVRVALTPAGAEQLSAARAAHAAAVRRRIGALDPAALQALAELTGTLVDVLEADLAAQQA
jgi:MarR family 2-MHQ and catechol resistance regulon transcriptional repressor